MNDTYQNWVKRVVSGRDAKPISAGETIESSAGEQFGVVKFARIQKEDFIAEVAKKGRFYIYHFYPAPKMMAGTYFEGVLCDVLVELFKQEDQIEVDWVPEMEAWAVRVSGWVDNIWGDDLAIRVIHKLDQRLTEAKTHE